MIALEIACRRLDKVLENRQIDTEVLPVRMALGRILAVDQHSCLDLPSSDKAAVDGYAVLDGDERDQYQLLETVAAGYAGKATLGPGKTVKVMTGASTPPGTGRVIMVEHATESERMVQLQKRTGSVNIRRKAEDVRVGQALLRAGQRLGPLEIACLIGCGVARVEVRRPVRIAIISTGDEIVDDVADLGPEKIMNSNGPMLEALARESRLEVTSEVSATDDKAALAGTLTQALDEADLIVLSGGVSAGDYDFVPEVAQKLGFEIHFAGVAVKPGRPTTFATKDTGILFGLPGNPVAVYLMFHLMVLRAAALLSGATDEILKVPLRLADAFSRRSDQRSEYVPCRLGRDDRLERIDYHGSAHLSALLEADGCFVVPPGTARLAADETVVFLALRSRRS